MRWLWWFTHSKCCWSFPNRCLSFWIKSGSCWNSILRVWKGFLGVNLTICCSIWDYVYIFCMVLFIFIRWQWGDYEKGQETTCLQNQEVKASRASPSPQRMPCLIHVPRAWAKSAPSHDSDNIFEIINEVAACLGWNGALRLLRFFWGGGCLSLYEYVWAICWVVWVAQVERIDGKQELRRTYGVSDQSDLGQPVQELLSQNERPHPPTL